MDHYARAYEVFGKIRGYRGLQRMLWSLKGFGESEVAQQRMKILKFYETYGEAATREAFGADRKLISRWRRRLREQDGKLSALIPHSTRPHRIRTSTVSLRVIGHLRELRKEHPRLGKEKIKPLLDRYCRQEGLALVSVSTIGNTIKRHKLFCQKAGRVYHDPSSHWAQNPKRERRMKVKRSPKPSEFGHILSDTVERFTDGIRDYFHSAMEIKSRFTLSLNYKQLSSRNMEDFYERFQSVYPGEIKTWQSDNGSENLGRFDAALKRDGIPHLFSYPRCPKINAYIERYNRTLQEEFIDNHLDLIHDKAQFHQKLADYLIFYNTQRIHKGLENKTPVDYLIEQGVLSQRCLTYTPS
jgi:transposase InsO family protein